MKRQGFKYIGKGTYSLPDAERITGIPVKRLRRWLEGYSYESHGRRAASSPIVKADFGRDPGALSLSFSDLLEVRFLDHFRALGVSWHSIRVAAKNARAYLQMRHPFSSRVFKTDGRSVLLEVARPDNLVDLLNLVEDQWEIRDVVGSALFRGVEFSVADEPERWWPLSRRSSVVLDPTRSFGAPIIADVGVRTSVLAAAARAERSQRAAAALYRVPVRAVRHAVAFEANRSA